MNSSVIITIIGRDRPGLLAEISSIISELNGNIEDIRGHTIFIGPGKKIANISLLVTASREPETLYLRLRKKLEEVAERYKLRITIYPISDILGESTEESLLS
ncbi:MAG: ACT domain-containing protein [Candidatus Njordarchaeales archaeon]